MSEWISVNDRLPKAYEWVIVTDGENVEGGWRGDASNFHGVDRVEIPTHWMPLPEPPKEAAK